MFSVELCLKFMWLVLLRILWMARDGTGSYVEYEPFTLIHSDSLVGFFPLDSDVGNIAPFFGERKDESTDASRILESNGAIVSDSLRVGAGVGENVHFTNISVQGSGLHFNGHSYVSIPMDLSPSAMPKVTVGAWIRLSASYNVDTKSFDFCLAAGIVRILHRQ